MQKNTILSKVKGATKQATDVLKNKVRDAAVTAKTVLGRTKKPLNNEREGIVNGRSIDTRGSGKGRRLVTITKPERHDSKFNKTADRLPFKGLSR